MWWTPERQSYAVSYLVSAGISPWGAAGLVSRWKNVEASRGPTHVNPRSGAFGIAQWLGPRLAPIAGNTDFDAQLAYVVQELNGVEYRAAQYVQSASDADSAAVGASAYERAEGTRQLYPRDNYTDKTAAGVAEVMANWHGGSSIASTADGAGYVRDSSIANYDESFLPETSGIGIGGVTAAVVAVVLLISFLDLGGSS